MCYSYKTSLVSFSLGMISCIFAFLTRQPVLGTLILFYSQMQFSEAMIWKGIDDNNTELNKKGTNYGKYLLPIHNIGIGIGIILSVIFIQKQKLDIKYFIPLFIGILFYMGVILGPYSTPSEELTYPADRSCMDRSCQNNGNRLKWPYPHSWYIFSYILSVLLMIIFIRPVSSKIWLGTMFTVSFGLSALIFPKSAGSVWCFSTAVLAPILVIGNYMLIKNKPNSDILS